MANKWNGKEEQQAEHPGQLMFDLAPLSRPAPPDKSETISPDLEPKFEKELT